MSSRTGIAAASRRPTPLTASRAGPAAHARASSQAAVQAGGDQRRATRPRRRPIQAPGEDQGFRPPTDITLTERWGPEIMRAEPPYLRGQAGAAVLLVAGAGVGDMRAGLASPALRGPAVVA